MSSTPMKIQLTCAFMPLFPFVPGGDDRHATFGSVTRASRFLTGLVTQTVRIGSRSSTVT
jgi:hypothetical protein